MTAHASVNEPGPGGAVAGAWFRNAGPRPSLGRIMSIGERPQRESYPRRRHLQDGDETHLKCSRSGARASWEKCSRNLAPASGAAVCLGNGSTVVDGGAQRDHEEVRP